MSFQNKILSILTGSLFITLVITGFIGESFLKSLLENREKAELVDLAKILESRIPQGGYDALLAEMKLQNASKEEKVKGLNKELFLLSERVAKTNNGLGAGFYSSELSAILTYAPSEEFSYMVGKSITDDHPGRKAMENNIIIQDISQMLRGVALTAIVPIQRGGKIIGYAWTNYPQEEIAKAIQKKSGKIALVFSACFAVAVFFLFIIIHYSTKDLAMLINNVSTIGVDLSARIPEMKGEIGKVASSINLMLDNLDKTNSKLSKFAPSLKNILNSIGIGIYICDIDKKNILFMNKKSQTELGLDKVLSDIFFQIFYKNNSAIQSPCFDENGKPNFIAHHREITIEEKRDIFITEQLSTWYDGRVVLILTAADVTEKKELIAANQANLAQRDFFARISHEIRTPINGVIGMTKLALEADPNDVHKYLNKIKSSGDLLLNIINDILDFSAIEAGKIVIEKSVINIAQIVDNVKNLIDSKLKEKDIPFIIEKADNVPIYAIGDSLRITQILMNLLGNASKFTQEGSISLSIKSESKGNNVLRLMFDIKDTGIGITKEQIKLLFKPFAQADTSTARKFGGTGLGLSICKVLVELMGGEIEVNSVYGKGTTFSFYIDIEQCDEKDVAKIQSNSSEEPWEHVNYADFNFLLVEDNDINIEIASAILKKLGVIADIAKNGQEAVDKFMEKDYSIIFMDVRMPVMDGHDATRMIRKSEKHDAKTVPIIAMTANAMKEDREESLKIGMNEHITKPINVGVLKKLLYNFLIKGE